METILELSVGGFPPLSARGCVQELIPITLGEFRRTVNGALLFLGENETKYKSIVSCEDKNVLASHLLAPGQPVRISCLQRLWQKVERERVVLDKACVSSSIAVFDAHNAPVDFDMKGDVIHIKGEGAFISYRPILEMLVRTYELKTDEWGLRCGWRLESEEI